MISRDYEPDPIIHRYTRAQAIEDGVLVDITRWASETGFKVPVACTRTLWEKWITPPQGTRQMGQCERGRGHDVLWMLLVAIRASPPRQQIEYEVLFLDADQRHQHVRLKAVCGPGDQSEPTITIMLITED